MIHKPHAIPYLAFALLWLLSACQPQPLTPPAATLAPTATNLPTALPSPTTEPVEPTPIPATPTPAPSPSPTPLTQFSFALTSDMRTFSGPGEYDTSQYFRGAAQALADLGNASFMITAGDMDDPAAVRWTIDQTLGADYFWVPVVGNHEWLPGAMQYLRTYNYDANGSTPPNIVHTGPPACPQTTFAFDYGNSHFVVLNEYCSDMTDMTTDGDISDALYAWLAEDLTATHQPHIFVIGHEPAFPQADAATGRIRHLGASLDEHPGTRDRFWQLLQDAGVTAYLCGHTHNYSAVQIDGVWQIDSGHARGLGDPEVPSTFVVVHVINDVVALEAYRDDAQGGPYRLYEVKILNSPSN
jgi:hypothetical protein